MKNQLPMSIFVDVDSLNKPTTFKLPMTKKQKFELELIMLTRKFNGEDNLNLKLMLSQMIDQFIDSNRDCYADMGLRPQTPKVFRATSYC